MIDSVGFGNDQRCTVPGCDHGDVVTTELRQFVAYAVDQSVNEAGKAEYRTGLHALDGVLADHRTRAHQFDLAQRSGLRRQGIGRDLESGRDAAAEKLTLGGNDVDTGRRTEVHDDARTARKDGERQGC